MSSSDEIKTSTLTLAYINTSNNLSQLSNNLNDLNNNYNSLQNNLNNNVLKELNISIQDISSLQQTLQDISNNI